MGRGSAAGPIYETVLAANDRTRHAGLDRSAHDRRERVKNGVDRPEGDARFLKGPDFALAAFKGQRLTLRDWNLQLRQPILLSDGRMIVSVSPQEGFLHQVSELDTLGIDRPESQCRLK